MGAKEILIGVVFWVIGILLLSLPLTFLCIYKCCVILIAKCRFGWGNVIVPSALDAMNIPGPGDERFGMNFGFVLQVEGDLCLDSLRKLVSDRLLKENTYQRLHCIIVSFGGYCLFQRVPPFEAKDLISFKELGEERTLEDVIAEWLLSKYKGNLPLWEMLLVPLPGQGTTVIGFRIHHGLADGYSLLHILDTLTNNTSPYIVKDSKDSCIKNLSQLVQAPCRLGLLGGDVERNPLKCIQETPYRWMMAFTDLDLKMMKSIRRRHDVHFSSIIASILGGALRRYLLDDKHMDVLALPSHLSMALTLPWPRHPAKNPATNSNEKLCNHWAVGMVKVPITDEHVTPVQRLQAVETSLNNFQTRFGLHKFFKWVMLPGVMWALPLHLLQKMFTSDTGMTAGATSLIGGDHYQLLDHSVTKIHPIIAIHDVNPFLPISIFSFTHLDKIDVTFSASPQQFPDRMSLDKVSKVYLKEELERLFNA